MRRLHGVPSPSHAFGAGPFLSQRRGGECQGAGDFAAGRWVVVVLAVTTGSGASVSAASFFGAGNFEAEMDESTAKKLELVTSASAPRGVSAAAEPFENFEGLAPVPTTAGGAGVFVDAGAGVTVAPFLASLSLRLEAEVGLGLPVSGPSFAFALSATSLGRGALVLPTFGAVGLDDGCSASAAAMALRSMKDRRRMPGF